MRRYPEYKESSLEWIARIPTHWQLINTKYLFRLVTEPAPKNNTYELLSIYTDIGVKPRKELEERGNRATTTDGYWLVKKGDFIVNKLLAWMGAIGLSNYEGVTSPAYDILRKIRPLNERFYEYLFRCGLYFTEFKKRSKGIMDVRLRLYFSQFGPIPLVFPPVHEQDQIVAFLDRKTQKIDELIRAKERKIELLQEYRASLINQAVTKGLDPNVEMNPSGVEWIGNVPKHWEVKKIKYLARLISKGTTPTTIGREILDHGEIRFIKAENIVDNQVKLDPEYYIDEETNQMLKRSQLKENDILFVIAGTIGKVGLVSRNHLPANTNQAVSFIRPYEKELPEFIYYWLQSDNIQQIVWRDVVQTAQPNLSMEDLGNLYIPYPSIAEQERIVDYISNKTRSIAQLLQQVYRQIELLKEYRQSLISAVVTGKIDVRNEV